MVNSAKHKKARVADFAKAKLKLGKGKQLANNATNTSIAARTIALPSQTMGATKDVPTSRRNLSLPELLVQSRHYSVPVKKEALTEMQQLFDAHPPLLTEHLLPTVATLSHLIADPAPGLRTQAIKMLTFIFDTLDTDSLVGVTTGLILFTISALSSLEEGVRIDALKVLDLLLERIPGEMVRGWEGETEVGEGKEGKEKEVGVGAKVVEGLMGVLRVRSAGLAPSQGGFTSAATGDLSPSSRVAILTTLSSFLRAALSADTATASAATPPWYLARSFTSTRDYANFLASYAPATARVIDCREEDIPAFPVESFDLAFALPSADLDLSTLSLPAVSAGFPELSYGPVASTSSAPIAPPASLLTLLHPTLLSGFLDTAPAAFAPGATTFPAQERATVAAVLSVARELYSRELGAASAGDADGAGGVQDKAATRKLLVTFLTHVGAYFPFGADELGKRSEEAAAQIDELNRAFCSLVSLLMLSAPEGGAGAGRAEGKQSEARAKKKAATEAKVDKLIGNVREWVVAALLGELEDTVLTATSFAGLEPTLWALLNLPSKANAGEDGDDAMDEDGAEADADPASEVFAALLAHFSTASTRGELKPRAFRFLARAVLAQSEASRGGYSGRFRLDSPSLQKPTTEWVKSLPKFLWELQGEAPTTELVLLFLLRLAQGRTTVGGVNGAVLSGLRPSLVPFFAMKHPKRGLIVGPFVKCGEGVQGLAMDLVVRLEEGVEGRDVGGKAVREAVGRAVKEVGGGVEQRWKGMK